MTAFSIVSFLLRCCTVYRDLPACLLSVGSRSTAIVHFPCSVVAYVLMIFPSSCLCSNSSSSASTEAFRGTLKLWNDNLPVKNIVFKFKFVYYLPSASMELQQAFLLYSFVQVELTEERILEIIGELPLTIKDKVMSTYDLLIEKGIERGRNEERAKAQRLIEQERAKAYAEKLESALEFKKMGLPVADIAKGLQLSVEEVEKL